MIDAPMEPLFEMDLPATPERAEDYESWLDVIRPAFEAAARSGAEFTIYEVAVANNLPEPPDTAHQWGAAACRFRADGLIRHVGFDSAKRGPSHHSSLKKWVGVAGQAGGAA